MKKLWLLLLMVTPLQLVHAQEVHYAPTVEQCRADQRLWLSKLETKSGTAPLTDLIYPELITWSEEMNNCIAVDPDNQIQYYNTLGETTSEEQNRFFDFIVRQNLYDQFRAEDAQGKR